MRIHFGNITKTSKNQPETEGLHSIRGPSASASTLIAGLTGFLLLICPLMVVCQVLSYFAIPNLDAPSLSHHPTPWVAVVVTLLLYIPLHELLHMVWHPHQGFSDQSILILWPAKMQFGVYYDGDMIRTRWLLMRIAPFVILSLVPAILLALFQNVPFNNYIRTSLEVLMVVNGVGSGGDVIAIGLVLYQVPRSAILRFREGKAYWKTTTLANNSLLPSTLEDNL